MKKNNKLSKVLMLLTSFQTILLGLFFIIQVLRIYYGNKNEFTREICAQYILEILPIIIVWILIIIGSFIYFNISNFKYKNISKVSNVTKQNNLERICPEIKDENLLKQLNSLKKKNTLALIILIVIVLISSVMGLCYLLNTKHFDPTGNLFEQAAKMSVHLLPWVIISFISFIIYAVYIEYNAAYICDIYRNVIKNEGKKEYKYVVNKKLELVKLIVQLSLITFSIVLIVVGVINGGASDTLQKAINICTECIGLG